MKIKYFFWFIFIFLAIGTGIYPFSYLLFDMSGGLLSTKPQTLLSNIFWMGAFYIHILLGAVAMLIGWSQFSSKLRKKYLHFHRITGRVYVLAVLLSGIAGFFIALNATGGWVAQLGFSMLAILWIFTTSKAFLSIKNLALETHRRWMIRSYALTFAAVTLRLWLPFFSGVLKMDFILSYIIIAWLCWVPNLLIAELIIQRLPEIKPQRIKTLS